MRARSIEDTLGRLRGGDISDFADRELKTRVPEKLHKTVRCLAPSALMFLDVVTAKPGATPNDLIEIMGVSKGAVSQNARRLIGLGLVVPYKQDGNMKAVHYKASDDGQIIGRAHRKMRHEVRDRERALFDEYSEDEITLIDNFLQKLFTVLS